MSIEEAQNIIRPFQKPPQAIDTEDVTMTDDVFDGEAYGRTEIHQKNR